MLIVHTSRTRVGTESTSYPSSSGEIECHSSVMAVRRVSFVVGIGLRLRIRSLIVHQMFSIGLQLGEHGGQSMNYPYIPSSRRRFSL